MAEINAEMAEVGVGWNNGMEGWWRGGDETTTPPRCGHLRLIDRETPLETDPTARRLTPQTDPAARRLQAAGSQASSEVTAFMWRGYNGPTTDIPLPCHRHGIDCSERMMVAVCVCVFTLVYVYVAVAGALL